MKKDLNNQTFKRLVIVALISTAVGWAMISYIRSSFPEPEPPPNIATMCCDKKGGEHFYQQGRAMCRLSSGEVVNAWSFLRERCLLSEKGEILFLLEELENNTDIEFSPVREKTVEWHTKEKAGYLMGKGFEAESISVQRYNAIFSFFQAKGFQMSPYNLAAGTISESNGYQKGNIACVVIGGISGFQEAEDQWLPGESDKRDAEVGCAFLQEEGER